MDALEFIRERNRMCKSFGVECENCPANKDSRCIDINLDEEIVPIVEKWSKENPKKTRQDLFLEQHPEANIENGVVDLCPVISGVYEDSKGYCKNPDRSCGFCRREFWLKEVE